MSAQKTPEEYMKESYFIRVSRQSPTKFWINNPSREQADLAIAHGAAGCTCNPSYTQKMLDSPEEGEFALRLLDESIRETELDKYTAEVFQRKLVAPVAECFLPIFKNSAGIDGYVSIQADPIDDEDPDEILRQARDNRTVSENICCKIPTTASGLQAMEPLMEENTPINATEIFGVSQMIALCELHEKVARKVNLRPVLYMSHIAGIYDDYFKSYVEKEKVEISPDVLWQAGLAVARRVYQVMEERRYSAIFIGGGARGLHHFTEMVGGKVCLTINWEGTADKLIESDPPVVYRLFNPVPQEVIDELMEKLPDFRRGYLDDGLEVDEFEGFGPVQLFRSSFIKSWKRVLEIIKDRRATL
jgi:transaldolase